MDLSDPPSVHDGGKGVRRVKVQPTTQQVLPLLSISKSN